MNSEVHLNSSMIIGHESESSNITQIQPYNKAQELNFTEHSQQPQHVQQQKKRK
jgi:hypothetical protein